MRPLKSLTFDSVRDLLLRVFGEIPDSRDRNRVDWLMPDVLLSAYAMFFFQFPNMLKFQQGMKQKKGRSNLETIFKVSEIPSDSQMREIIDGIPIEPIRALLPKLFEQMRRIGWTNRFVTAVDGKGYYTLALDGSEYFHSEKIECPSCLRRQDKNEEIHYSHSIVSGTLVKEGTHQVLPLDVEEVRNSDGTEKQDCEINAAKRLIERVRREHRQLSLIVNGDALYAHEPYVKLLRENRMSFVLGVKPGSQVETFAWVNDLEKLSECEHGEWKMEEGPVAKRRYYKYRIARAVPLSQSGEVLVNFVELWVYDHKGKQTYHNTWITDLEVSKDNVAVITGIGRSRWKIENEQFNVQKNHGYNLEHNYGHGQKTLSMVFYLLNLLAFVTHLILEMGDHQYQKCKEGQSRSGLWELLRAAYIFFLVDSWSGLLTAYVKEREIGP